MIAQTVLVAAEAFGARLDAERVAAAIGAGLRAGGRPAPDLCPLGPAHEPGQSLSELLGELDFDARMRRARALLLATPELCERALLASAPLELATRARQAGVPAYAIAAVNSLERFDARILDLQLILEARSERALVGAGKRLAKLI